MNNFFLRCKIACETIVAAIATDRSTHHLEDSNTDLPELVCCCSRTVPSPEEGAGGATTGGGPGVIFRRSRSMLSLELDPRGFTTSADVVFVERKAAGYSRTVPSPEFQVTALSVSNLTISNSSLGVSGTWSARCVVRNPNKKLHLEYYGVISMVYYRSELLAQTQIPPFKQETKSLTSLTVEYSAASRGHEQWCLPSLERRQWVQDKKEADARGKGRE
ncbi:hypothetical protein Tsubulata_022359 [Turnera subulata]|uniref:Late embryogenesis abundant protein LEA-2 subgroup domain-containing protein n=1 Tax=Turnera subulata TaxID=218843 RepID=A0A9Q0JCI5_9ROSI|nr:hypothetical protein Tsubulata_022359 [Turnera subulata]